MDRSEQSNSHTDGPISAKASFVQTIRLIFRMRLRFLFAFWIVLDFSPPPSPLEFFSRSMQHGRFKWKPFPFQTLPPVTISHWSYGVTVSTLDSESSDRGSNPRRTYEFWRGVGIIPQSFFKTGKQHVLVQRCFAASYWWSIMSSGTNINFVQTIADMAMEPQKIINAPPAGLEPAIFGLEVRRLVH